MAMMSANAGVVYTDITDGIPSGIDFNQDGTDEFSIDQVGMMAAGDYIDYWAAGADNNIHAVGTAAADWDVPGCVTAGYTIDATGNWIGAGDCAINGWGNPNPSITAGQDTYVAMRFNITGGGSDIYYGWLRINVAANGAVTYKDYAYNDTPGEAIQAGDMGVASSITEAMIETLNVFPNPAKDQLNVVANDVQSISVFDIQGSLVSTTDVVTDNPILNVANWDKGIYFLQVTTTTATLRERVVVE